MIESIWPQQSVKELIQRKWLLIGDGYRVRRAELGSTGTPFIRGGDIGNGWISTNVEDHVLPEYEHRLGPKFSQAFDVAFITKGSVGRVGLLRPGQPRVVFAPQVCFWRSLSPDNLNPRFLFYLLGSRWFQTQLDGVKTSGSMVADYVSLTDQQHFRLPLPPEAAQRRIAEILGAFDDKIELNRKMNRTLVAMAQALFKSWFVDFDGHDDLVDSELGPIPRGWQMRPLDEVAHFLNGTACQKYPAHPGEDSLPVIKIRELNQGVTESTDRASLEVPAKWRVEDGDILFSWSGSLQLKVWAGGPGFLNQHLFKVTSEEFPDWFYFSWTLHHLEEFRRIAADKATTMGHIKRRHLSEALCAVPPSGILNEAGPVLGSLFDRQQLCREENQTLAEIRDTLLPKLISGEIRVPEAEKRLEAVL